MVSAGNRLCPILRNRERGLEGRQYRHTSGHLQCTLYLPTCLCTFPEQRNRPAPAMRLDLSACQSPQRNRCHHPASPVAGPRTIACRTSIRLHCRHPTGIARQPASFPLEGTKQIGEQLLEDILSTGNFGQHDNRIKPRPKGYWAGKWYTFCRATRRCNELRQFAPYEALWYPVTLIGGTIAIQINRLKGVKDKKARTKK